MAKNRLLSLSSAIREHVRPGMHLHFASSPSRSNAAVRELGRAFLDLSPDFILSSTGFHSSAHTLALLGLGRRYVGCFFGDNYPTPRPNGLYRALAQEDALEHWSLLTYTLALRAGALGHPYAVTTSLGKSDLGAELARAGRLFEVSDPAGGSEPLRLLTPIVPDVTFVHAVVGTASGRALFSAPFGEGFHGALAATRGVIVTAERIVEERELALFASLVPLPPARVLAIAEEPFGAHPQPLYVEREIADVTGYADDFTAYEEWRERAERPEHFAAYRRAVLEATDGRQAYFDFVGGKRLEALRASRGNLRGISANLRETTANYRGTTTNLPGATPNLRGATESSFGATAKPRGATAVPRGATAQPHGTTAKPHADHRRSHARLTSHALGSTERLVLLAARAIERRVRTSGHSAILAGIGQAFSAARVALLLAPAETREVELLVETGISGFDARQAHPFLLSAHNMAAAQRLSSVEDNLGVIACGGQNRCLAVVGCAEADVNGNLNSSAVGGELIVGSGGASDLTANAREVVVLCRSDRLVSHVQFVTSPGDRVRVIVTEDGVLERNGPEPEWELTQHSLGRRSASELLAVLPFAVGVRNIEAAAAPSESELDALAAILGEPAHVSKVAVGGSHA